MANSFHGPSPFWIGQALAAEVGFPAQIVASTNAEENVPSRCPVHFRLIKKPDQKPVRIAGNEQCHRGDMPKLGIALRLHPFDMFRIAHAQFVERKLHVSNSPRGFLRDLPGIDMRSRTITRWRIAVARPDLPVAADGPARTRRSARTSRGNRARNCPIRPSRDGACTARWASTGADDFRR